MALKEFIIKLQAVYLSAHTWPKLGAGARSAEADRPAALIGGAGQLPASGFLPKRS